MKVVSVVSPSSIILAPDGVVDVMDLNTLDRHSPTHVEPSSGIYSGARSLKYRSTTEPYETSSNKSPATNFSKGSALDRRHVSCLNSRCSY